MKTTEGNQLIARFMVHEDGNLYYPNGNWIRPMNYEGFIYEHVHYDTSWDWLMPVVEKIESFGYNPKIHYDLFMVEDKDTLRHVTETSASPKIMAVWHGVIQFIQWYNENKEETK